MQTQLPPFETERVEADDRKIEMTRPNTYLQCSRALCETTYFGMLDFNCSQDCRPQTE